MSVIDGFFDSSVRAAPGPVRDPLTVEPCVGHAVAERPQSRKTVCALQDDAGTCVSDKTCQILHSEDANQIFFF